MTVLIDSVHEIYVHWVTVSRISAVFGRCFEILVTWASVAHVQHAGL